MKKEMRKFWTIIISSITIITTVVFKNNVTNSNRMFAADTHQDYLLMCPNGPFTPEQISAGWVNNYAASMESEFTDRLVMVTESGNKIFFNSFGHKSANANDCFMSFSTWNDSGWKQGWFYNQDTSPFTLL